MYSPLLSNEILSDEEPRKKRISSVYSEYTDPDAAHPSLSQNSATLFSCYINLTNTIIGAGVLALPYAVAMSGSVLGIMNLIINGLVQFFSLHILAKCAAKVPHPASFYTVTQASVPSLSFLIDLAVAVQSFGVCSSYLIVMGGLMPDVMDNFGASGVWKKREIWIFIGFALVAPLTCLKKLDALKFTSVMSVMFVLFLTMIVFLFSIPEDGFDPCSDDDDCRGSKKLFSISNDTLRVFSIFTNAYACQSNVFAVVNEIKDPTQKRIDTVSVTSLGTSAFIYGAVALAGFFTYGDNVDSNILVSYPSNDLISICRVCVSLLSAFSYPIVAFPGRNSILGLWRFFDKDEDTWIKYNKFRYWVITAMLLGGTLLVAMEVEDLGVVFALVGATGATIVSFILPGAAYYTMFENEGPAWMRIGALCLACAGCVIMPVCSVFIFI